MFGFAEVCEYHSGVHEGYYYFVVEGSKLIHISYYAVGMKRRGEHSVCYIVDLSRVREKMVIRIYSTLAQMFPGEELSIDSSLRSAKPVELVDVINRFEPAHLNPSEKSLIVEWNRFYRPMASYIRGSGSITISGLAQLHIAHDLRYPLSLLIPYSTNVRRSLYSQIAKQIHQAWVAVRILREFKSHPLKLVLMQSSYSPADIVNGYGMWHEFDLNPLSMCRGVLWNRKSVVPQVNIPPNLAKIYERMEKIIRTTGSERYPMRPDIVFTYATRCSELIDMIGSGKPATKLIIECKNSDYRYWAKDIETQIKPYAEILQPEFIVIASMKPVPAEIKKRLSSFGIDVIDNVYPGGTGEKELVNYVKKALS